MKQRIQITLDDRVYALIKNTKANKSKYIEDLILRDFQEEHRDSIIAKLKESLLSDENFLYAVKQSSPQPVKDGITYTNEWGA